MPVHHFAQDDIPLVADLYWTVLRERKGPSPVEVRSCIRELYFENPWIEGSIPSLIFDEKGRSPASSVGFRAGCRWTGNPL
jgi:hypothetical protein